MKSYYLEDKFSRLARSLIGDKNISFGFSGSDYYCESNKDGSYHINFAMMPSDPPQELINSLEGFLDHEVAHALFTDFSVMRNMSKNLKYKSSELQTIRSLFNTIEDKRIEDRMGEEYIGSRDNIAYMNSYITEKIKETIDNQEGWSLVGLALHFNMHNYKTFGKLKKAEEFIISSAKSVLKKIKDVSSTQESLKLAVELYEKLKQDENNNEDKSDDNKEDSEDTDDNNEADEKEENADSDAEDQEDSEGGDSSSSGSSGTSPKNELSAEEKSKQQEEYDQWSPYDWLGINELADKDSHTFSEKWKEELLESSSEDRGSYDDEKGPLYPRPYTRSQDTVAKNNYPSEFEYQVNSNLSFYVSKIARIIKSETLTGWERGIDKGLIDCDSLYKIKIEDNIFKKKNTPKIDTDISFCLGVDNSVSMKKEESFKILVDIFEVLGRINVPFEVFSYTTLNRSLGAENDLSFSRTLPLSITVIKDYHDSYKSRIRKINLGPQGYTPTPEAYEYAINSLSRRKEKRKVFINITDGYPQEHGFPREAPYYAGMLKNLMQECVRKNIAYVNIGYKVTSHFKNLDPEVIITNGECFLEDFVKVINNKLRQKRY